LRVTGITTLGQTNITGLSNAGISTLGNATATTLVVSGVSTFNSNVSVSGGALQINVQDGLLFDVGAGAYSYMRFGSQGAGEGVAELAYDRANGKVLLKTGNTGSTLNTRLELNGVGETIINNESGTERARIDSSGRLLVGTSSESGNARAIIAGNTSVPTGTGAFAVKLNTTRPTTADQEIGVIRFESTSNTSNNYHYASIFAYTDGASSSDTDIPGRLVFSTTADGASSPTERMRITQAGILRIGQTTSDDPSGSNIAGTAIGGTGYISVSRDSNVCGVFARRTTTGDIIIFRYGTIQYGSISTNGSSTSYNTSSDYRLKENIAPVTGALSRLQQLKPSRFNFVSTPDLTVDGFIAHEVQDVVPEAITGAKDAVDDDGNPVYQGIDQAKLVPLLTAALQEAIAKIETLEAKVAALEAA